MKILIAEPMAAAGIELLRAQPNFEVIVADPKTYVEHLADAEALLVRSAVKVTAEVLAKAPKLRVIGRAGVGVDNVDLPAATAAGVLVMNTPGGNAVSVAEHTLALMLAMARSIPQASASTKSGKWEKKKFLGNELRGKTLGIVGMGSIGREVLKRARAFEMRIVAHDPYVSPQVAADLAVELLELSALYSQSDYITLHMALTPETERMMNADAFARMKPSVRIVNCARGELVDTDALQEALASGRIAGAALDVFAEEPPAPEAPILKAETLLATPHIGGSTEEAQEIVGVRIAEQLAEYLNNGVAISAVNMPALSPEQYKSLGPYVALAERLGTFASHIATGNPTGVRLVYQGQLGEGNTTLLRNAGLAGVMNRFLSHKANLVNAMQIAGERKLSVAERHEPRGPQGDTIRLEVETDQGCTAVEGAVLLDKPRLTQAEGIRCEVPLTGNLLYLRNEDVPGVIGYVGTMLGSNHINIANFSLGRQQQPSSPDGLVYALAVVETDGPVPEHVLTQLLTNQAIKAARSVALGA